jgi:shikimate dehydrogenase
MLQEKRPYGGDEVTEPPTDNSTLLVWLYGHPVSHSLSPRIHNAAFRDQGLALRYLARDVTPEVLADAVLELRSPLVRGANITLPHKEAVVPLLDRLGPQAAKIRAVNTIVNENGRLIGHNTDVAGFKQALRSVIPGGGEGLKCLVLGAGGAARAVVGALLEDGAARIWVANRTLERAVSLCHMASDWSSAPCLPLALSETASRAKTVDIVVNATSLGLLDSVKELPIDVDTLHDGQVLVDIVYRSGITPLVEMVRMKGILAVDGKEMLVQQAARSYEIWTGRQPPLEVMRGNIEDRAR